MASAIEFNEEDFSAEGLTKIEGLYREAYPEITDENAIINYPRPIFYLDTAAFDGMEIDGELHTARTVN